MGKNLVLNIESCGFMVGVYNCYCEWIDEMMCDYSEKKFVFLYMIEDFVNFLEKFCWILMMV